MVTKRWPGRPPRARHTRPMISLDRLACRAYRALALKRRWVKIHRSQPAYRQHQRPRCSLRIIGMLWTGRSCRRRQRWLWRKRKRAAGPTSAPKLRQNRFKYSATSGVKVRWEDDQCGYYRFTDLLSQIESILGRGLALVSCAAEFPEDWLCHFESSGVTNVSPSLAGTD